MREVIFEFARPELRVSPERLESVMEGRAVSPARGSPSSDTDIGDLFRLR